MRLTRVARVALLAVLVAGSSVSANLAVRTHSVAASAPACGDVLVLGLRGFGDPQANPHSDGTGPWFMGDDVVPLAKQIQTDLGDQGYQVALQGIPYKPTGLTDFALEALG